MAHTLPHCLSRAAFPPAPEPRRAIHRRQRELAALVYEPNVMKSRPNTMTIVLPSEESAPDGTEGERSGGGERAR